MGAVPAMKVPRDERVAGVREGEAVQKKDKQETSGGPVWVSKRGRAGGDSCERSKFTRLWGWCGRGKQAAAS